MDLISLAAAAAVICVPLQAPDALSASHHDEPPEAPRARLSL